ncbi:hypothetical protein HID58_002311, partial [Brassica napus]
DKKQYGELYAILKEIQGLLRHSVAAVKISTQFSLWSSALLNFVLHSQTDTYFCGSSCFSILTLMIPLSYPRQNTEKPTTSSETHDLFSMMVPDAADYMERINITDINEGQTCY